MLPSIQATIDEDGTVHLQGTVDIQGAHRAIVTILDETPDGDKSPSGVSRAGKPVRRKDKDVLRETAGLWASRHGDGLEYIDKLRSEWGS